MWGEPSKPCESNCQCSGLITDSFKINSGNNATKRRRDEAISQNFKFKMNPHPLNLEKPPSPINKHLSPVHTPRRVLGQIQNSPLAKVLKQSPLLDRSTLNIPIHSSPVTTKRTNVNKISRIFEERCKFRMENKENHGSVYDGETFMKIDVEEDTTDSVFCEEYGSPVNRGIKRSKTVTNWTLAELTDSSAMETPTKVYEDSSLDSGYANSAQKSNLPLEEQTIDFSDIIASTSFSRISKAEERMNETETASFVPENERLDIDSESDMLHDLEQEFESDCFDECTKYEIISTDSPNIISKGRSSRKITSKNFVFGAPISETETSTSFNKPNVNVTRMLNFDDETFEFTSPMQKPKTQSLNVKKSLKFSLISEDSPKKLPLMMRDRSGSSIGSSMSSPPSSHMIHPSTSTQSLESGFISGADDSMSIMGDTSNSPKLTSFTNLLSGQIKTALIQDDVPRRPAFARSISYNPEGVKAKMSLFTPLESPGEKRLYRNRESIQEETEVKRMKSNPVLERNRPVLQRAYSESAASIMAALAKSAANPNLIGDFSLPFALPLTCGQHTDLKSISCDTLAGLLKGQYKDSINDFQVIDCRYPYEYHGGHIRGSQNMFTPDQVLGLMNMPLQSSESSRRSVLVFHCEFSLERGPKLSRFLRSSDRAKNKENYPSLHYPEVYLLHEGYKTFHQNYPSLCEPTGYTPMLDPKHKQDLHVFRAQSESTNMKKTLSMDEKKTLHRQKSRSRLLL